MDHKVSSLRSRLPCVKLASSDKSKDASIPSLKIISWNIEGLARNIYNLDHFLSQLKPNLIFLSEPQVFSRDIKRLMSLFSGSYKFILNSEDSHDPDLPMDRLRAKGDTVAMWDCKIDQYVTVLKTSSPSVSSAIPY